MGIDPGSNGGIALYFDPIKPKIIVEKLPTGFKEIKEVMLRMMKFAGITEFIDVYCVLEHVEAWTSDSATPGKSFNITKLLKHSVRIEDVMFSLDITFEVVHPIVWQKKYKDLFLASNSSKDIQSELKKLWKKGKKKYLQGFANDFCQDVSRDDRVVSIKKGIAKPAKVTLWNADAILLSHLAHEMGKLNLGRRRKGSI